jgi:hypothetical protein
VRQDARAQHGRDLPEPAPDPAVSDDAERGAVEIAKRDFLPPPPAAVPYELRERAQALEEVEDERERPLGDGTRPRVRRYDDRDVATRGGRQVDRVDADAAATAAGLHTRGGGLPKRGSRCS